MTWRQCCSVLIVVVLASTLGGRLALAQAPEYGDGRHITEFIVELPGGAKEAVQ